MAKCTCDFLVVMNTGCKCVAGQLTLEKERNTGKQEPRILQYDYLANLQTNVKLTTFNLDKLMDDLKKRGKGPEWYNKASWVPVPKGAEFKYNYPFSDLGIDGEPIYGSIQLQLKYKQGTFIAIDAYTKNNHVFCGIWEFNDEQVEVRFSAMYLVKTP